MSAARRAAILLLAAALFAGAAADGPSAELLRLPVRRGAAPPAPLGDLLAGAPAMVSFWATYCPPCRVEVPVLKRAARRWRTRGVRVVGVALGLADAERAARAARDWGVDYESYWVAGDADEAATRLIPGGLPATFFIRGGEVVRYDRLLHDADVDALVPKHLGVAPLPRAGGG